MEELGYDTSEVSDETMEYLAKKLGNDYCEQLFWTSLDITAKYMEIPKKESKEILEWDEDNQKVILEF